MAKKRGDQRGQDKEMKNLIIVGAIIGVIWAFIPYTLYFLHIFGWELNNPTISHFISFPALFAVKLGFGFYLVFIGAPLVAMAITIPTTILIYKIYKNLK